MAGMAASVASTSRQVGTTVGAAIAGTIVGSTMARGSTAYTDAEHAAWWLTFGLGLAIVALGLFSTGGGLRPGRRVGVVGGGVDAAGRSRPVAGTPRSRR